MSDIEVWTEGAPLPDGAGTRIVVDDRRVKAAWRETKARMEGQGFRFRDIDLGSVEDRWGRTVKAEKFGGWFTKEKGVQALVDELLQAVLEHFNAVPAGVLLVRAQPHAVDDPGVGTLLRARFAFEAPPPGDSP